MMQNVLQTSAEMNGALIGFCFVRFVCIGVVGFGILNIACLIIMKVTHEKIPRIWEMGFTVCGTIFLPATMPVRTDFEKMLYEINKSYLFAACLCWILYVILYMVLTYRKGVVRRMLNLIVSVIYCVFGWIESLRVWIEQRRFARPPLLSVLALIIAVVTAYFSTVYPQKQTLLISIAVLAILWFIAMELCENIFSCRGLLKFWFGYGFVSAVLIVVSAEQIRKQTNSTVLYFIFIFCYIIIWTLTALLGDDAAVKMALLIVNTLTTISTVVLNIVLILFAQSLDAQIMQTAHVEIKSYNQIAIAANMVLLPFFAAGFLASLGKEMQIYWRTNSDEYLQKTKECAIAENEKSGMH